VFSFGRAALPAADDAERDFAAAALRTLLSAAWVFGPAIGAVLLAQIGFTGLFVFAAASFTACAVIVALIAERRHGDNARAVANPGLTNHARALTRRSEQEAASFAETPKAAAGSIRRALVALTLIGLAANATMIVLPLYIVHGLGGTRLDVSTILGLGALLEIPMMLWLGARSARLNKGRWLAASAAVHVVYFVALAALGSVRAAIPLQALSACVVAITSCLGMTYVQDLMPRAPASATALFFNAARVGSILSGVLSGVVIGAFGYRCAFVLCAGLALCAFALFAVDAKR
jgi:MFS transporter, SET family, sugar efflux transporter